MNFSRQFADNTIPDWENKCIDYDRIAALITKLERTWKKERDKRTEVAFMQNINFVCPILTNLLFRIMNELRKESTVYRICLKNPTQSMKMSDK